MVRAAAAASRVVIRALSAVVVVLVVVSLGALRAAGFAWARLAAAVLELAALRARSLEAEARVDDAIARLDALQQLRIDDVQRMRTDVRELREQYERVVRQYEARAALEAPAGRVVH